MLPTFGFDNYGNPDNARPDKSKQFVLYKIVDMMKEDKFAKIQIYQRHIL
jgi:hypothetical protein